MKHITHKFAAPLALVLASAGLAACSQDPGKPGTIDEQQVDQKLASVIDGAAGLSTIDKALADTGLLSVFESEGSYTILAPDDDALASYADAEWLTGEDQRPVLAALLRNHIVPGHLTPKAIKQAIKDTGGSVKMKTLGGGTVTFTESDGALTITGLSEKPVTMSAAALAASNGVVFPIDGLLEEPVAE